MKKVKNVWFVENKKQLSSIYCTGLIIELEDGRLLAQQSTDVIMPFEELKHNTESNECWCNPRIIKVKGKKLHRKIK